MRLTLANELAARFSVPARSVPGAPADWPGDVPGDAAGQAGELAVVAGTVGGRRLAGELGEAGAERAERAEADRHAHVGDRQLAQAQQRLGPLDPPGHQVGVRG